MKQLMTPLQVAKLTVLQRRKKLSKMDDKKIMPGGPGGGDYHVKNVPISELLKKNKL